MSPTAYRVWLAAILFAALLLRLAAGGWWQSRLPAGQKFAFGDSEGYWELARTIAAVEPYQYGSPDARIFRTPGYPVLLAVLFRLYGGEPPVSAARALSALLGVVAVALVVRLGHQLFDANAGLLAGAWTAIYPEAIAMSTFVLSEAPFCVFMLLQLSAWISATRATNSRGQVLHSVTAGIWAGIATLMRPSWLLFIPFAGALGVVAASNRWKHSLTMVAMLAGLCLTMLPWWVRNYSVAGRFVPTTLQVGASLYDGLSPAATGGSEMGFVAQFRAEQLAADAAADEPLAGTFEDRLDRRMLTASCDWVRQNPLAAIRLSGIKFLRMWNVIPNATEMRGTSLRLALAATYAPTILLSLIGVWRFRSRGWPYLLCLLPAIYFTLLHCIFVSSIRYRQPAMLPLIVLAAAVVCEWWNGPRIKRYVATVEPT
jgi:4-amino-4-deoxy-L-arabinose transferase-like glycosyltransferase